MKRKTDILTALIPWFTSMLLLQVTCFGQQTLLLAESFESGSGSTPPAGWTIQQVTGTTPGITFVTSSTNPTVTSAYEGLKFTSYNSLAIPSGSTRLFRNIPVSTSGLASVLVDFAWFEDPGFITAADKVEVQWSTDGVTWTSAGSFLRYNAQAGWKFRYALLPFGAVNQPAVYIGFLFTSGAGNNCSLDDVHVSAGPLPPPAYATIGQGTSAAGYPFYTYYMGSRTQMLYTAAELTAAGATAGNLTSAGFNVNASSTQLMSNFTINMGHTASSTLTGWIASGMTTVYQVNYSVPGTGWQDISFTTPFVWNGTSNVVVEICYGDNGTFSSNSTVYGTVTSGRVWHQHNDNWAGCTGTGTGSVQGVNPNIRFGYPPVSTPGILLGFVKDSTTHQPLAGATIHVGSKITTTDTEGFYIIYNLPPGNYNVMVSAQGHISQVKAAVMVSGQVTRVDFGMIPGPKLSGTITDASTGLPIIGATITVAGIYMTMSVAGGTYSTPYMSLNGTQTVVISKTGYDDFTTPATLVANTTTTVNAALLQITVPTASVAAALNQPPPSATFVNLSWTPPNGLYEMIYDDGIEDAFAVWPSTGNMYAVKFTPAGYPAILKGGSLITGTEANYPGSALPLDSLIVYAILADGPGGLPGTVVDSVLVTPLRYDLQYFTFPSVIQLNSGDLFIAMKQLSLPPQAAGIAVDMTTPQSRSYSKEMPANTWVQAPGNYMIRAKFEGPGGPMMASCPMNHAPLLPSGYQAWRLIQGEEGTPANWIAMYMGNSTSTIDNAWPMLPDGPYRWAVRAVYGPGQRLSAPTFSNVLGKNWVAPVSVCVGVSCSAFPLSGSVVKLVNLNYPDTNYQAQTNANGCVTFPQVWKGSYKLMAFRTMFDPDTMIVNVMGPASFQMSLNQSLRPVTNLEVEDSTLVATWDDPEAIDFILNEPFSSGNFTANQWTISGGTNWNVNAAFGNPAPTAVFSSAPQVLNYNQYLTSKTLTGLNAPSLNLRYDIYLDIFGSTYLNTMAVEVWNGSVWSVLKTYDNMSGDFPWTTELIDISSETENPAFKIRFHASGIDSYDINSWFIDNIMVYSGESGISHAPCISGYGFYLNNVLLATVPDTTYAIPPPLVYNQSYNACVTANYNTGSGPQTCVDFISHFLFPPGNLQLTSIANTAYLHWDPPINTTGMDGYNIYRDGKKMNDLPQSGLDYTDPGVTNGYHLYMVRAQYGMYESLPAGPLFVVISGTPSAPVTMLPYLSVPDSVTVAVPVTVENFTGITAFSLRVEYDPTVMEYSGFSPSSPALQGLTVEDLPVSSSLRRLMIFWSGSAPVSFSNSAELLELYFFFKTGATVLSWNNTANSGYDCEYADSTGEAMLDIPTNSYYINGQVEGIPAYLWLNYYYVNNGQSMCFNAQNQIEVAGYDTYFIIDPGGSAVFAAGKKVLILPGTQVFPGGYLHAYIATENNYCGLTLPSGDFRTGPEVSGQPAVSAAFNLYPNPTEGQLTLQFSKELRGSEATVRIYNLLGEQVKEMKIIAREKMIFCVENLPKGVYLIHVTNKTGATTHTFIKQ